MSLFNRSGRHSPGKKPPVKKQNVRSVREEKQPAKKNDKEAFNRRMAESLGYSVDKPKTKARKGNKKWMIAGVIVGCLAVIALLTMAALMIWTEPPEVSDSGLKVQETVSPTPAATPEGGTAPEPTATPAPTEDPTVVRRRDNTYTVLVVGRDRVGMNTDTLMLAMLDGEKGELNVVSIPRDTLVNVSWSVKKINSIYGAMGTEGLINGVENLIGYEIDNYVIVNTFVFQEIIDAIGGVYFDVPLNMYYDDPGQNLHISINAGYQWLNGYQAEQVVRFRQNNDGSGYPNGDLGRIETQQKFGMALAKQLLSVGNIANLPELVNIVLNNTDTDLTTGNIAFYAEEFLKLKSENIRFHTLPCDNVNILGGSYVSIRLGEWLDMINTWFNPYNKDVTQNNLDILMYANGSTWSTTGYSQPISSFYDYNAAAAAAQAAAEEAARAAAEAAAQQQAAADAAAQQAAADAAAQTPPVFESAPEG